MFGQSVDRAQAESLGSLLLVAVVVVSAGMFGAYYIASTGGGAASGAAGGAGGADGADLAMDVTEEELRLSHNGGASVSASAFRVVVENASGEYTYAFDDGAVRGGDGDDRFDPGEAWRLAWDQPPNTEVTVSLIDTENDRLLFRDTATTGSPATDRPADLASGEQVDGEIGGEEGGDADEDDNPSEPWLDVDDDGDFESDDGDETVDLSGGSIPDAQQDKAEDATLRVPADVTVNTGDRGIRIDSAENVQVAGTFETTARIDLSAPGSIDFDDGRLDNDDGDGEVVVDAGGALTADSTVVRSKAKVDLGGNSVALPDADIDNSAGDGKVVIGSDTGLTADGASVRSKGEIGLTATDTLSVSDASFDGTVGDGDGRVTIESKEGRIDGSGVSVQSRGKIQVLSSGPMSIPDATLHNDIDDSDAELVLDSGTGDLDGSGASVRSGGKIAVTAEGSASIPDATFDNGEGDGKATFTSGGDVDASRTSIRSKGKITMTADDTLTLAAVDINGTVGDADGEVDLESKNGDIEGADGAVRARGKITVTSEGSLSLIDATVDNADGDGKAVFDAGEDLNVSRTSIRSTSDVTLTSEGSTNVTRVDIDGTVGDGDGKVVIESKSGGVEGSNASVRTRGKLVITSDASMTLTDAVLDNAAGDGKIDLTVKEGGDISLVRANVSSSASAEASVPSGRYEVDVTDAIIDDDDDFLEVNPSSAVTGEPESGGAGNPNAGGR